MDLNSQFGRTVMLPGLVLGTVLIQIIVAILLKELADARPSLIDAWTALVILGVAGLNGVRFLVWGYTHRHFPLSRSYPLTALFFPCILLLSAWYGDPVNWTEIAGVSIIMAGITALTWEPANGA